MRRMLQHLVDHQLSLGDGLPFPQRSILPVEPDLLAARTEAGSLS